MELSVQLKGDPDSCNMVLLMLYVTFEHTQAEPTDANDGFIYITNLSSQARISGTAEH